MQLQNQALVFVSTEVMDATAKKLAMPSPTDFEPYSHPRPLRLGISAKFSLSQAESRSSLCAYMCVTCPSSWRRPAPKWYQLQGQRTSYGLVAAPPLSQLCSIPIRRIGPVSGP